MLCLKADTLSLPASLRELVKAAVSECESELYAQHASYPDPSGEGAFIECTRAIYPHWDGKTLVTNSATEALFISLLTLKGLKQGSFTLAVRVPCFFALLRQAELLGVRIVPFERIENLADLSFDALLLTSNFSPPFGLSLTEQDREVVREAIRLNNAWLIEDNPYDALWFERAPEAIEVERVIRVGSVSKILSPAFRLGFIKTDDRLFKPLRSNKITLNLSTASVLQKIAARAISPFYLDVLRRTWHTRANVLFDALGENGITARLPEGGSFLGFDADIGIIQRAEQLGVALDTNEHYYPDRQARGYVRCHLGALATNEAREAARLLGRAFRRA